MHTIMETIALGHMQHYLSWAQLHELPQNYCSNNREGTLFS